MDPLSPYYGSWFSESIFAIVWWLPLPLFVSLKLNMLFYARHEQYRTCVFFCLMIWFPVMLLCIVTCKLSWISRILNYYWVFVELFCRGSICTRIYFLFATLKWINWIEIEFKGCRRQLRFIGKFLDSLPKTSYFCMQINHQITFNRSVNIDTLKCIKCYDGIPLGTDRQFISETLVLTSLINEHSIFVTLNLQCKYNLPTRLMQYNKYIVQNCYC